MDFTKWLLQGIKLHAVSHGILTKLSSLIHLYSSFYNSLTIKQVIPDTYYILTYYIFDSYDYIIVF